MKKTIEKLTALPALLGLASCALVTAPIKVVSTATDVAATTVGTAASIAGTTVGIAADIGAKAVETKVEKTVAPVELAGKVLDAASNDRALGKAERSDKAEELN